MIASIWSSSGFRSASPFLLRLTLSIPLKKKSPIFCLLLPLGASFSAAEDSQILRICALMVSWISCQSPFDCSLAGMGFALNHLPLANKKKSLPGFTVESICEAIASGPWFVTLPGLHNVNTIRIAIRAIVNIIFLIKAILNVSKVGKIFKV